MASSRSLSSPEAELRHYLQDLLLDSSVKETGRELRRTTYYSLNEVTLGGGLSALAVVANENSLQLQGEQDPEYVVITERLAEECNRFSKLRHPNVIQFLGVSFPKGSLLPILVTEKLEVTLSQILHKFVGLPDSLKTSLLLDISLGLQAFHETCSLAHGNLIASSVFLTPSLTAKLSYPAIYTVFDNDIKGEEDESPITADHQQQTNGSSGLHHFSSTSSITTGTGKTMKDDIFALGELMVHVITQRRPKRVGMGHSPSLIQQTEHIDGGHLLRGLIMQCLQKDPILRPTASEIVQEIKMATTTKKTPFQDPVKVLSALLDATPIASEGTSNKSPNKSDASNSPKELRLKRLEQENGRLQAQLKVTQSELRHLRVQQTLFGEEEEKVKKDVKNIAIQVEILQVNRQKVYIELRKESKDQSFGFSITGGKGAASTLIEGDQSIFITRLAPGGLAEIDGRLKPRDQVLSVNGIDMTDATRADALAALGSVGDVCTMVVSREEVLTESDPTLTSRRLTLSSSRKRSQSKLNKLHPLKLGVSLEFEECSPLPESLSNAQAVVYKNKVIIGGHYSSKPGNLFEYDPETDKWNLLTTAPVWFFGLTVFQDKVTAVGGFDSKTQCCSAQLFAWNEREETWLGSLPSMPTPRMHATAVSLGTSLAVAGGRNNKETLKSVEVFNFASQQWYTAHPLTLEQSSMRGLCHNGLWYLLGGEQQGFPTPRSIYTQLQSLIDSALHKTGSVSCFKAIMSLPNVYPGVALSGGKIVAIGGNSNDSEATATVYALCEDPFSWLEVGNLPIPLSHSCAVSISDEEVLIIGGQDEDGKDTDVVYRMYLQEATTNRSK